MAVSLVHETALWDAGASVIAGIDEVGRGALAGPVTVGVCAVARCDTWPDGLADSKELKASRRVQMVHALSTFGGTGFGVARAVGHASPAEIDAHGIVAALRIAGLRALGTIAAEGVRVDAVLLDGKHDWLTPPAATLFDGETTRRDGEGGADPAGASAGLDALMPVPKVTMVVKGDTLCASIAAGSVVAKVERDAIMTRLHPDYPEYGWASNMGYGAAAHVQAIRTHGSTPIHRRSWKLPAPLLA